MRSCPQFGVDYQIIMVIKFERYAGFLLTRCCG